MKETQRLESFQDHSYLNFVITSHSETYLQFHESTVLLKKCPLSSFLLQSKGESFLRFKWQLQSLGKRITVLQGIRRKGDKKGLDQKKSSGRCLCCPNTMERSMWWLVLLDSLIQFAWRETYKILFCYENACPKQGLRTPGLHHVSKEE